MLFENVSIFYPKLIRFARVNIPLIYIVSAGLHSVDSHFVHCIFIWKCRKILTHPDPSPAKSLCRGPLWPQVESPDGCAFDFNVKPIRLDVTYKIYQYHDMRMNIIRVFRCCYIFICHKCWLFLVKRLLYSKLCNIM